MPIHPPTGRSVLQHDRMDVRERILDSMQELALTHGVLPSLDAVAKDVGLSKGGLIHHLPNRIALVDGLIVRAVRAVNQEMRQAAEQGRAAETWLQLSLPDPGELDLFRAMLVALKALGSGENQLSTVLAEATQRWDDLLRKELGDQARARIVRLVGDGLFLNALAGTPVERADVETIVQTLTGPPHDRSLARQYHGPGPAGLPEPGDGRDDHPHY